MRVARESASWIWYSSAGLSRYRLGLTKELARSEMVGLGLLVGLRAQQDGAEDWSASDDGV